MSDGFLAEAVAAIPKVMAMKKLAIERGLTARRTSFHCPVCGEKNACVMRLALNRRSTSGYHAHVACTVCPFRMVE